jgi:hypothetical protein
MSLSTSSLLTDLHRGPFHPDRTTGNQPDGYNVCGFFLRGSDSFCMLNSSLVIGSNIQFKFTESSVGFKVLTEVIMNVAIFWDMAPCNPYMNRRFG